MAKNSDLMVRFKVLLEAPKRIRYAMMGVLLFVQSFTHGCSWGLRECDLEILWLHNNLVDIYIHIHMYRLQKRTWFTQTRMCSVHYLLMTPQNYKCLSTHSWLHTGVAYKLGQAAWKPCSKTFATSCDVWWCTHKLDTWWALSDKTSKPFLVMSIEGLEAEALATQYHYSLELLLLGTVSGLCGHPSFLLR